MELCQACKRGEHAVCGMQTWCECEDGEDGLATPSEVRDYYDRLDDEGDN